MNKNYVDISHCSRARSLVIVAIYLFLKPYCLLRVDRMDCFRLIIIINNRGDRLG